MPTPFLRSASLVLIIANVAISMMAFSSPALFQALDFHVASIRQGEIYRIVTSAFLHADFGHLLFNMITLFFFGPVLESRGMLGRNRFLLLYFVSMIAGGLWTLLVHFGEPNYAAVGASGAISGVMVSVSLFAPLMMILFFGIIPVPAILFAALYITFSALAPQFTNSNIGHEAHLGGAVAGFALTVAIYPRILGHVWKEITNRFRR